MRPGSRARRLDARRGPRRRRIGAARVASTCRAVAELEAELREHTETTDVRSREIDRTLGKLRREARDASNARRAAEAALTTLEHERDALLVRVGELEADSDRARADSESLRAHAVVLGDELAAAAGFCGTCGRRCRSRRCRRRSPNLPSDSPQPVLPVALEKPAASQSAEPQSAEPQSAEPRPPSRSPRRRSPQNRSRRNRRRCRCASPAATPPRRRSLAAGRESSPRRQPAPTEPLVGRLEIAPEEPPAAEAPVVEPPPAPIPNPHRRTALAEFTALATSGGDEFTSRRR